MSDVRNLWRGTIAPVQKECVEKTGVRQETINDFLKYGTISEDPGSKCFFHCVDFKLGIINSAGDFDAEKAAKLYDYVDVSLAQKCGAIVEPDP
ncbi:hypothetical protein ILUMI_15035, partial [Ignelater luminosus]